MNSTTINQRDALVIIDNLSDDTRTIKVKMHDPKAFCFRNQWTTHYTPEMIYEILRIKGPAWLCDEIQRDEDPDYVQSDLKLSILSYVDLRAFSNKTILDFGCGAGASTAIIARMFPDVQIIGLDMDEALLAIARLREKFYRIRNLSLICSEIPDRLPESVPEVDFVILSGVLEHLLPDERPILLQIWERLVPGGIMFINQTPDRRFPVETHTTGLPLLNYCPDNIACLLARRFSRRVTSNESWASLLRKGIRGAIPAEVLSLLGQSSFPATLLRPHGEGIKRQSDIWYRASSPRLAIQSATRGKKGFAVQVIVRACSLVGLPIAPYISLAIRKGYSR